MCAVAFEGRRPVALLTVATEPIADLQAWMDRQQARGRRVEVCDEPPAMGVEVAS